jgi:membrane-associated phospholipid phosphatase
MRSPIVAFHERDKPDDPFALSRILRSRRAAILCGLLSACGFALLAFLALRHGGLHPLDQRGRGFFATHDHGTVGLLAHLFSLLGQPVPQLLLGCGVVAIGLKRRVWLRAALGILVVAGADLSTQILKHSLTDHRLGLIGRLYPVSEHTFPSGHTTTMTAMTFAYILVIPRRLRLPVACVGVLLIIFVGIAMMVRHQHRPSDVVGGALVGCTWGFAGVAVLAALESKNSGRRRVV